MEPRARRAVVVDWSGAWDARAQRRRIWLAEALDGMLLRLEAGRTRDEVVHELCRMAGEGAAAGDVVAGLDFCFSFPAGFVEALGCRAPPEIWQRVARDGERWLAECRPPFWGRPGRRRPARDDASEYRRTERELARARPELRPKSVFQVGGAGSVGTASLRGMPALSTLRDAGWAVWPFDPPAGATLAEVYPRQLTGAVVKRRAEAREAFLRERSSPLPRGLRGAMVGSEDAFDAGISALVLSCHTRDLDRPADPPLDEIDRIEGRVWAPG